jgi:hypothetical protein
MCLMSIEGLGANAGRVYGRRSVGGDRGSVRESWSGDGDGEHFLGNSVRSDRMLELSRQRWKATYCAIMSQRRARRGTCGGTFVQAPAKHGPWPNPPHDASRCASWRGVRCGRLHLGALVPKRKNMARLYNWTGRGNRAETEHKVTVSWKKRIYLLHPRGHP